MANEVSPTVKMARELVELFNEYREKRGLGKFTQIDEVEAVILILIRRNSAGGGIIGHASPLDIVTAVITLLLETGYISQKTAFKMVDAITDEWSGRDEHFNC